MAVTVTDLIAKREEIKNKRKNLYDIETSIGTIVVKQPTIKSVDELLQSKDGRQGDIDFVFEMVVEPNLKDTKLQEAFACAVPSDIVPILFKPGEISQIVRAIMRCGGFGKNLEAKIHEEVKNS